MILAWFWFRSSLDYRSGSYSGGCNPQTLLKATSKNASRHCVMSEKGQIQTRSAAFSRPHFDDIFATAVLPGVQAKQTITMQVACLAWLEFGRHCEINKRKSTRSSF
jgi:hypothetical protein